MTLDDLKAMAAAVAKVPGRFHRIDLGPSDSAGRAALVAEMAAIPGAVRRVTIYSRRPDSPGPYVIEHAEIVLGSVKIVACFSRDAGPEEVKALDGETRRHRELQFVTATVAA